jgi:hypothetical protein
MVLACVLILLIAGPLLAVSVPRVTAEDTAPWWDGAWSYRLPVVVEANGYTRTDQPAELQVNFTQLLNQVAPAGIQFDEHSIRVVEVDSTGSVINDTVVFQFDKGSNYDAATNASGTLVFLLDGTTPAGAARTFHIYFATSGGNFDPPGFANRVQMADVNDHEGQQSFRITTSHATYYYHKQGAGFASLEDADGSDWLGFHPTPDSRAAGEYRGLPNLGVWGHPGYTNGSSTLVSQGPLRVTIASTASGGWVKQWAFYPTFARMTILDRPDGQNYWFLYEGVPGGGEVLEPASDYYVLSSDPTEKRRLLGEMSADIGGQQGREWAYFGDDTTARVLFLSQHTDDSITDNAWPMEGSMVVFGFGRKENLIERLLDAVPATFTIGFAETTDMGQIPDTINATVHDLHVLAGDPLARPDMRVYLPMIQSRDTS